MSVVTVLIDSPRNKNLVPTKWHSRNTKLKTSYNIRGFPTYLLLDSNLKILGKLGAGRNKTAGSFSAEVRALLPRSSSSPITNITTTTTTTSTSKSGVVWEFEDGNSGSEKWIKYLPQDATILENAFISKKSTVQVTNKYGTYSITLPSGTSYGCQVKQGSGFRRRVRRGNKTQQQQQLKKITTAPVVAFGKMTQDFDGAKRLVSASSQGYILLAFSGSDWCGWCKIMDQNVFAKTEWEKKSVCCFFFFFSHTIFLNVHISI